jgi:hypothetical protein
VLAVVVDEVMKGAARLAHEEVVDGDGG